MSKNACPAVRSKSLAAFAAVVSGLLVGGCASAAPSITAAQANALDLVPRNRIHPIAAHHQHLIGPAYMADWHKAPMNAATLPPELDEILRRHSAANGAAVTPSALGDLYASDTRMMMSNDIIQGAEAIGKRWASYQNGAFVRYVVPIGFRLDDDHGHIVGIMVETPANATSRYARRLMHVLMTVEKGDDGVWRIVAESGTPISHPDPVAPITAASLVEQLHEAGIRHGIVAGLGYEFADSEETPEERARVQAENDWTVQQVAQFPGRLVTFCGLNPIRTNAIAEMDRCAAMPGVRGMKLYLHNRVNLENPTHVEKLREFVRAANDRRLPLLVHLSMDFSDGGRPARIFLERIVSAAPDIPIQIAHTGGGSFYGKGPADEALKVFADAAAAGNPLMKNLYFDATGSVFPGSGEPPATYELLAQRMRTIGLERVLFGSDLPLYPLEKPSGAWAIFRQHVPLSDAELQVIATNLAPYAYSLQPSVLSPARRHSESRTRGFVLGEDLG